LWTPWRYQYITNESGEKSGEGDSSTSCIFCTLPRQDPARDEINYILSRARHNFIVLNLYPYTSGHLLIIPYEHTSELDSVAKEATDELMDLAKRAQTILREAYRPDGFNPPPRHAALGGRREFYEHRGRDARPTRRPPRDV
jgi:ATP adenylyltransferase